MKKLDVEKVRGEISHHISPVIGWLRMDATVGKVDFFGEREKSWLERLDKAAEAIVEMSEGETELEYCVLEARSDSSHRKEMIKWSPNLDQTKVIARMYSNAEKWGNDMRGRVGVPTYSYEVVSRPKTEAHTVLEVF